MSISNVTIGSITTDTGSSGTDFVTNDTSILVTGTVTKASGNPDTLNVFATIGTTHVYLGSVVPSNGTGVTWTITSNANSQLLSTNGTYTIQVYSANGVSNTWPGNGVTPAATHALTFDNVIPTETVTITSIGTDDGSSNSDYITHTASQVVHGTYTGTLQTATSTTSAETLQVSVDGGTTWVNATASAGSFTANVTLSSGTHNFLTRVVDVAGNASTAATGPAYTLDQTPPAAATVTAISADTGTSGDFITSTAAQTVSGTLASALNAGESVQVSVDGGTSWITGTTSGTTWSAAGVTLAGSGTISVRTVDTAGNITSGTGHAYTLDTASATFSSVPGTQIDHWDTNAGNLVFSSAGGNAITVADAGNTSSANLLTVAISVTDGTFAVNPTAGVTISGSGTQSVSLIGLASNINAALEGAVYHSNSTNSEVGNVEAVINLLVQDAAGNPTSSASINVDVTCFMAGTMIRTPEGDVAVEKLQIGQHVTLADGRTLPVKWIGQQVVALLFADPLKTAPICIKAGALDENVPSRDLYTSAGHAMILDGNMVIAGALVNGRSVVRAELKDALITYYHIELDEHAVIFANDAATETYCDNIAREVFTNAAEYKKLYPNAKPIVQMDLPTVKSQRQLPAATKKRLAARAAAIAGSVTNVA